MDDEASPLDQICIQVQPARAPDLDLTALQRHATALAKATPGVRGIECVSGDDEGAYLNVMLAVDRGASVWPALRGGLLDDPALGPLLRRCCMVLRTGDHGWDDHRLLFHFDPAVPVDAVDTD